MSIARLDAGQTALASCANSSEIDREQLGNPMANRTVFGISLKWSSV
jgi:hypothetical protein